MRRRSFLATTLATATGLSGCSGLTGEGSSRDPYGVPQTPSETPTETPSETPTEDPNRVRPADLSNVLDLGVGPRTLAISGFLDFDRPGIRFNAGFTRTATEDHPATLTTILSNERDVPAIVNSFEVPTLRESSGRRVKDRLEVGGYGIGDEERPLLLLEPTANDELAPSSDGFRRGETYWRATDHSSPRYPERIRLDPQETVVAEQAVVGGPETRGRPTGVYRFDRIPGGLSVSVWNTDAPGPTGESHFRGVDVERPDDRTVGWYHEAGPETGTFLRPGREVTDLPAKVPFQFVNHTREEVSCGGWRLYKRHGGEWFHIGASRNYFRESCRLVRPGGTVDWTLFAFGGQGLDYGVEGEVAHHLGGGRYAVTVGFGSETDASGALLDVEADRTTVRPTDDATVERDGSTVVVESIPDGTPTPEVASVTATRVGRTRSADRHYIPEQVMQPHRVGLRNLLGAFQDGVERVRLRTTSDRLPETGVVKLRRAVYEISGSRQ